MENNYVWWNDVDKLNNDWFINLMSESLFDVDESS